MEGNIYKCGWKKEGKIYHLWLQSRPDISIESDEFDEGYDDLAGEICTVFGDGEAILEFEPVPPIARVSKRYFTPDIVLIGYHRAAEGPSWPEGIFTNGYCRHCARGMGERTDRPAVIERAMPHEVMGLKTGNYGTVLRLFSGEFLQLLTAQERASLDFLETENRSNVRKTFYELRAVPKIGFVSFKGAKYNPLSCWRCPSCGYRAIFPGHPLLGFDVTRFIAAADISNPLPSCFAVGSGVDIALAMTRDRWMQMRGKPGTKGVALQKVGVIPDGELVRDPKLREGEDLQKS